jgi:hypothetical protein
LVADLTAIATEVNAEIAARKKIKHGELTGVTIGYPNSSANWGVGTLTLDTDVKVNFNSGFVTPSAQDTAKLTEAGLYQFEWTINGSAIPPDGIMAMKTTVGTDHIFAEGDMKRTKTWNPVLSAVQYCAANEIVMFYTYNRSGTFSGDSRIKVTKLQGT